MTGKLAGEVMETGFLSGKQAAVLITLASVSDENGQSWHSYDSIAHRSRAARSTVIDAMNDLENIGLITIKRGYGLKTIRGQRTKTTNLVTLHLEFLEAVTMLTRMARKADAGNASKECAAAKSIAAWAERMLREGQAHIVISMRKNNPTLVEDIIWEERNKRYK